MGFQRENRGNPLEIGYGFCDSRSGQPLADCGWPVGRAEAHMEFRLGMGCGEGGRLVERESQEGMDEAWAG